MDHAWLGKVTNEGFKRLRLLFLRGGDVDLVALHLALHQLLDALADFVLVLVRSEGARRDLLHELGRELQLGFAVGPVLDRHVLDVVG